MSLVSVETGRALGVTTKRTQLDNIGLNAHRCRQIAKRCAGNRESDLEVSNWPDATGASLPTRKLLYICAYRTAYIPPRTRISPQRQRY